MLVTIELRKARKEDILSIAQNMREQDKQESKRSAGWSPYVGLKRSLRLSIWSYTVFEEGEPIAMFGVAPTNILSEQGNPWFIATDRVTAHKKKLIRYGRSFVHAMLDICPHLYNTVDPENIQAIRFIKFLGFEIKEETVKTLKGYDFLQFEMRSKDV